MKLVAERLSPERKYCTHSDSFRQFSPTMGTGIRLRDLEFLPDAQTIGGETVGGAQL